MSSAFQIDPVKRVRYFDGQFLQVSDFNDEQTYHRRTRQYHRKNLFTAGVVEGLVPTIKGGKLEISPGIAVDAQGRQIVLAEATSLPARTSGAIYLQYHDESADPAVAGDVANDTRVLEKPQVTVGGAGPPADGVRLGRLTGGSVSTSDREIAKVKMDLTGHQPVIVDLRHDVDRNKEVIDELVAKMPPPLPEKLELGEDQKSVWIASSGANLVLNPDDENGGTVCIGKVFTRPGEAFHVKGASHFEDDVEIGGKLDVSEIVNVERLIKPYLDKNKREILAEVDQKIAVLDEKINSVAAHSNILLKNFNALMDSMKPSSVLEKLNPLNWF